MYEEMIEKFRSCSSEISCSRCKYTYHCGGEKEVVGEAAKIVETLSKAQEQWVEQERKALLRSIPKWIPVTERLPDDYAEVNIAWKNTDQPPYYEFVKDKVATGSAVYCKGRWYWYSAVCADYLKEYGFSPMDAMDDAIRVIAWMPLPIPPTEE